MASVVAVGCGSAFLCNLCGEVLILAISTIPKHANRIPEILAGVELRRLRHGGPEKFERYGECGGR